MAHRAEWLASFTVGEVRYLPTTLDKYNSLQRSIVIPRSRRPDRLAGLEFTTALFTAIAAGDCSDIRYLVAVERVA